MIATVWQSIAQIDQRYGRAARDAICAASTAQVFIPPLAEPTSAGYLTELLGEEPVANASTSNGLSRQTLSVGHQKAGPSPWLRQIRARASDPDLPRPAARDRARARLVRGPPLRTLCPPTGGAWSSGSARERAATTGALARLTAAARGPVEKFADRLLRVAVSYRDEQHNRNASTTSRACSRCPSRWPVRAPGGRRVRRPAGGGCRAGRSACRAETRPRALVWLRGGAARAGSRSGAWGG